jgi:MSHA biogenesis protein MshP
MKDQRGFGVIAAIVVLVILAGLASAMLFLGSNQQMTIAQDVLSARAWQAARAGNEWGLYQALKGGWQTCSSQSSTLDLRADTDGFYVTVSCDSWLYQEGETAPGVGRTLRVFEIRAVACPAATCPAVDATAAGITYVERSRLVIATAE